MIQKKGRPITGTNTAMRSRPPVLSDAARTSRDSQRQINQPPQPFANPHGPVHTPAPVSSYYNTRKGKDNVHYDEGASVNPMQKAGGYRAHDHSIYNGTAMTAEQMAAVGYKLNDTRSTNSINNGHPTGNPRKIVGAGNFPKNRRER